MAYTMWLETLRNGCPTGLGWTIMHSLRRWIHWVQIRWFDDGQGNAFEARVVRSGNHATGLGDVQTHYRQPEPLGASSNGIGFRCVRSLED